VFPPQQVQDYTHGFGNQSCSEAGTERWEVATQAPTHHMGKMTKYVVNGSAYPVEGVHR